MSRAERAAASVPPIGHRQISHANVCRVYDFGLARLAEDGPSSREFVGTPKFMAPEQYSGGETTVQSDIYSLGLVLYELFTGEAPPTRVPSGSADKTQVEYFPPRSNLVHDIDPAIDRIILECLQFDPGERPTSADAVARALPGADTLDSALAAGETPSPDLVAAAQAKRGLSWRTRFVMLATILIGMALIANLSGVSQRRVDFDANELMQQAKARGLLTKLG